MRTKIIGACLIALTANSHAQNMSINCEFALLKQARETLIFCGEKIDPVNEVRYDKLTKDFEFFIASSSGAPWDSAEKIRSRLLSEGRDRVCNDPDYPLLQRAFSRYVSDAGMAAVGNLLSRPRDPNEGDCF